MEWTQVTVITESEAVEAVSYILDDSGATGVKIEDSKDFDHLEKMGFGVIAEAESIPHLTSGAQVTAYFPQNVFVPEILPTIQQRVNQLREFGLNPGVGKVIAVPVDDEDWATAWEKYYQPVRITHDLTVVPEWIEYQPQQPNEKLIRLDPGMAFGTGTHPTTTLMLQALEMEVRGGESMIDVGTGSGVLSIVARLLGADEVQAYDLDQIAVDSALENIKLNPEAAPIKIGANSLLDGIHTQVDLIVANILAEIIVPLVPQAFENLKPGGKFLTSGIIADKFELIYQTLVENGFEVRETLRIKDWYGIIAIKPLPDED